MCIRDSAEALHISVSYLLDESETDSQSHIDQDLFILEAKENFGSKGAKEAQEVLGRVNSLFAGGELDEDAKDVYKRQDQEKARLIARRRISSSQASRAFWSTSAVQISLVLCSSFGKIGRAHV